MRLILGCVLLFTTMAFGTQSNYPSEHDVVWTRPSENAAGSMPIGNGEVVLNVWVEKATGDLVVLIARTDTFSEISRILKVGRIRVKLTPSPFLGSDFKQWLNLLDGIIELSGQDAKLKLFVDSERDVFHVSGQSATPRTLQVLADNWRNAERTLPASDMRSAWSAQNAPFPLIESGDVALSLANKNQIGWKHLNSQSIVPRLWEEQTLTGLRGTFDPIIGRTFGALISGDGLTSISPLELRSTTTQTQFSVSVATHTNMDSTKWLNEISKELQNSPFPKAEIRTQKWWNQFWNRSKVNIREKIPAVKIPANNHSLRQGADSDGGNKFDGTIENWCYFDSVIPSNRFGTIQRQSSMNPGATFNPSSLTLSANITLSRLVPGRIFDKLTAGQNDGFLFDTHPGNSLRFIVGDLELVASNVLSVNQKHHVVATFDGNKGEATIYLDGVVVATNKQPEKSLITQGYVLQRYVQACQGRGEYPIKFNGGYYTVEPTAMGIDSNPDFRNWGDAFWFQNMRHMYHPMMASGDIEMTESFFRLYEKALPLAESRARFYHGVSGAYFPETMTAFGTYAGKDYGWDRTGLQPNQVQCPWWDDAWNQGPELVNLMLDRWDYTRDNGFLTKRTLPMADAVLKYFDTRFKRDSNGRLLIDPTQVVETYWSGVVNDMPCVAGLNRILDRLLALPSTALSSERKTFYQRMKRACPSLPLEAKNGELQLAPAQTYSPEISNVENGELYAVWPFGNVSLAYPKRLKEAKTAYANRKNQLDRGWGYDGNVAAMLGMADEAGRILNVKVRNSHPAYRWPATWGPNFDWLPDQNHGGNLLNQTHLMLLQCEPIELGGAIRLLPAWPKDWDVEFKLHAPGKTVVECVYSGGQITKLKVTPESRRKDVILPTSTS